MLTHLQCRNERGLTSKGISQINPTKSYLNQLQTIDQYDHFYKKAVKAKTLLNTSELLSITSSICTKRNVSHGEKLDWDPSFKRRVSWSKNWDWNAPGLMVPTDIQWREMATICLRA